MPRLYNRHHGDAPKDAVYIGRGTPWGNPFVVDSTAVGRLNQNMVIVASRDEACDKFENLTRDPLFRRRIKDALRGKDLVCSCYPKRCHGDTLLRIANE